jgi:hypothetical protein
LAAEETGEGPTGHTTADDEDARVGIHESQSSPCRARCESEFAGGG